MYECLTRRMLVNYIWQLCVDVNVENNKQENTGKVICLLILLMLALNSHKYIRLNQRSYLQAVVCYVYKSIMTNTNILQLITKYPLPLKEDSDAYGGLTGIFALRSSVCSHTTN